MTTTPQSSSNWKNVNNWHWVEKNCNSWAIEYLTEALKTNAFASNKEVKIKVKKVDSIEGDVDVNQRKGKVLYFYDLKIKCCWEGETLDKSLKATGTFTIPEFSNEIVSLSDLSFHVEIDDEQNRHSIFRSNLAEILGDPVFRILKEFHSALEQTHGSSIIIPTTDIPKDSTPHSIKMPEPIFKNYESSTVSTSSLKQSIEFFASQKDLFKILTNQDAITIWTRNPVNITTNSNGDQVYHMFQGHVNCIMTNVDPENYHIKMKWRLANWDTEYYSTVTINMSPSSDHTMLYLEQHGIPTSDYEQVKSNWKEYYWNSIKRIYGFGFDI